jgi:dCTP deaminase
MTVSIFGEMIGVLGYQSIQERLYSLKQLKIEQSGEEILKSLKEEQPEALKAARRQGLIVVDPFYTDEELERFLSNVSLDLELGDTLRVHGNPHSHPCDMGGVLEDPIVDLGNPDTLEQIQKYDTILKLDDAPYILAPGVLVKATTYRMYWMPYDLMGLVVGKSRIGRWGIATTVDAPKIDPGFSGHIILELTHHGQYRFALQKGMPISQIIFFGVEGEIGTPYDENLTSHFDRQDGINYL